MIASAGEDPEVAITGFLFLFSFFLFSLKL